MKELVERKVSVVVPSYNQGNFLEEALNSVLAQTYTNWECIIINDGSIDNTEEIARKFLSKDKRFRYIKQSNQGVVAARNKAISVSVGEYILPLDGDDKIANTYIEKAVKILESNKQIKIVGCEVEKFGAQTGRLYLPTFSMKTMLAINCFVVTSLFRKEDFEQVGGFNNNMTLGLEDWDLWLSLLENGGDAKRIPETLFFYRFKEGESRNNRKQNIDNEVKKRIVSNHPFLYYVGYKDLYSFTQSRSYKLATLFNRIGTRIRKWIRKQN